MKIPFLTVKDNLSYQNHGMLSPAGEFYPCEYGTHCHKCYGIVKDRGIVVADDPEDHLLDSGWLHLQSKYWSRTTGLTAIHQSDMITQKQIDFIFEWAEKNQKTVPWISGDKHEWQR